MHSDQNMPNDSHAPQPEDNGRSPDADNKSMMRGRVKWFSSEKGYGFITGDDGVDRHFAVRDVVGAELPREGRVVEFEPATGSKGPRAQRVSLTAGNDSFTNASSSDERALCAHCGKRMIPRIITGPPLVRPNGGWTPVPRRSICPFCGQTHKEFDHSSGELVGAVVFVLFALIIFTVTFGSKKADTRSDIRSLMTLPAQPDATHAEEGSTTPQ